jgi:outer membrane biogenesis lipoprotein LolB
MESFEAWLEELPIQTLTYELKDEIKKKVEFLIEKNWNAGYEAAKQDIVEYITNKM